MSRGKIELIFGPMFSGKTDKKRTELIKRIKRFEIAKKKCMVIKYENDTRYDDELISSHDKQKIVATVKTTKLNEVKNVAKNFSVIGIDEGQFFKEIVEFCEEMANLGKIVIVAALDGTYQRKGFGNVLNLVPLAESVIKLTAVCMICYNDAPFTKRRGNETQVELIGGEEAYMAVCRSCFFHETYENQENFTVPAETKKQLNDLTPPPRETLFYRRDRAKLKQLDNV